MISSLSEFAKAPIVADRHLKELQHTVTLVDGTMVDVLLRIATSSNRKTHPIGPIGQ